MPRARLNRQCQAEGCPDYVTAKGYCNRHYQQLRKRGSVTAEPKINYPSGRRVTDPFERFSKLYLVATPPDTARPDLGPCWLWTGSLNHLGYSQFYFNGKPDKGHRFSYEHFVGSIPEGMELDHLCRIRRCVNYAHLEAVTHHENLIRSPLTNVGRKHRKNRVAKQLELAV